MEQPKATEEEVPEQPQASKKRAHDEVDNEVATDANTSVEEGKRCCILRYHDPICRHRPRHPGRCSALYMWQDACTLCVIFEWFKHIVNAFVVC